MKKTFVLVMLQSCYVHPSGMKQTEIKEILKQLTLKQSLCSFNDFKGNEHGEDFSYHTKHFTSIFLLLLFYYTILSACNGKAISLACNIRVQLLNNIYLFYIHFGVFRSPYRFFLLCKFAIFVLSLSCNVRKQKFMKHIVQAKVVYGFRMQQ